MWLGVSGGGETTPRSVSLRTLPAATSTVAITFSIGLPQRLLPLPSSDQAVAREQGNIAITENVLTVLTDRERQIMALVSEGLSNKGIGRVLNITDGTIKVHLHSIFRKLEISNRTVLAIFVLRSLRSLGDKPALLARLD